jgi:N-acetylglucosaminylphosphatidylinositol deacetylase
MEINNKRILLAIAHPDDESMFFLPMIQNLIQRNRVFLICFSNGNFDGQGKQREKELKYVCDHLGVTSFGIIEHEELQDGMKERWNTSVISSITKKWVEINAIDIVLIISRNYRLIDHRSLHLM